MCPQSIARLHFEFAQMLEFMDGFQLVLVTLEVIRLPQGLWSTDFVIAGWLPSRLRVVLLEIKVVSVGIRPIVVLGIGTVVVGVISGSSGCLRLLDVQFSH